MILRPSRIRKSGTYLLAVGLQTLTPILNWGFYTIASVVVGGGLIMRAEMDRLRHKYKIDDKGLLYEEGLLKKKRTIVTLKDITNLKVKQGLIERLMRYGDVEVETYGNPVEIKSISKPSIIAERIKRLQGQI